MAMTTTGKLMPPAMQRPTKGGDPSMITMSNDYVMMKQIKETHWPDGTEVDKKRVLQLFEGILKHATLNGDTSATAGSLEHGEDVNDILLDDPIIDEVSEMLNSGGDAHAKTLAILEKLARFSWDAKLVLTLAALASNYGDFWLLHQIWRSNKLAKFMAPLKRQPTVTMDPGMLKSRFDQLNSLIQPMRKVTGCLMDLEELPSASISSKVPSLSNAMDHVPIAAYWTIRSAVACARQITNLKTFGRENEASELSTCAHKLTDIYEHLQKQITICHQHIEEKRHLEAYQTLLNLFETIPIDNMKILKALINPKDDNLPLVEGNSKKRVNVEVLRRRNVLLLISGLDISQDELSILGQMHSESKLHATRHEIHQYEVVWIPMVDRSVEWTGPMQKQFEDLQSTVPWYTVYHPSLIDMAVIRFIKEKWHFRKKPILVLLDPQGKVVCPNAIHMMWIWGSNAFPFTTLKEEALWKEETWRLELLVDDIDQTILTWIGEDKYIFLYGGDDIEWIRKFTTAARQVAQAARIPLEMVYVGKSSKREQVQRAIVTINNEKLSYTWQDLATVWFFWTRIESMLFSKIQHGKADERDPMMQQIKRLLSFDKAGGWAVLSKGSSITVNGHGTTVLPALLEYDQWKEHISTKGYDLAFKEHHDKIHDEMQPCCQFEFPTTMGRIPESMRCPECMRLMEKLTTFTCCHDEVVPGAYE